ncbi:hypothetical protein [Methylobacterium sp. 391_Methyba4]|uniref:hypothetical protein n=1 Tax=Methylobacterium sp. 391_Methyba4 TaxID=3038924 RepID=UPI00241BED5F|nr:hypothetical protein [Methylobacterium sp. 391_Methyba4]WFS06255.1 hypothetical protein P9K36_23060 [Methylobacterium sp. 391_Methyba4]
MPDLWVPFHVALQMVADSIGSKVLAWEELPRLLREGLVRSIAECTDVHEVTGEHMRKYEAPVPLKWWSKQGRFRRSSFNSKMYLMIETKSEYVDRGIWFHNPHLYDKIRIFVPDIERHVPPNVHANSDDSEPVPTPTAGPATTRKRGPQPKKLDAVVSAMRKVDRAHLEAMREKDMEHKFNASRDTCRRARELVLSEFRN